MANVDHVKFIGANKESIGSVKANPLLVSLRVRKFVNSIKVIAMATIVIINKFRQFRIKPVTGAQDAFFLRYRLRMKKEPRRMISSIRMNTGREKRFAMMTK